MMAAMIDALKQIGKTVTKAAVDYGRPIMINYGLPIIFFLEGAFAFADKPLINLDYATVRTAVTNEKDLRTELYPGISANLGELKLSYNGNQRATGSTDSHFSRNIVTLCPKDWKIEPCYMGTDSFDGETSTRYNGIGIKDASLVKALGGNGWLTLTANHETSELAAFYEKAFGIGSASIFQSFKIPLDGDRISKYTELQLNKTLSDNTCIFIRAELPGSKFDSNTTYMIGFGVALK